MNSESDWESCKIMWKYIDVYKVGSYKVGDTLTDEEMQCQFMWRKTLNQVKKMKVGKVVSMDHPIARLAFQKVNK